MRKEPDVYRQRLGWNFRPMFTLRSTVALRAIRAWAAAAFVPFLAIVAAIRLARTAPVPIAVSRTVGAALSGIRILALKIGVIIRAGRLVRPGGQRFQVQQIFGGSRRRHPFSFTPSESEVNCPKVNGRADRPEIV